jgi:ActR/RegA family two-component response regulator
VSSRAAALLVEDNEVFAESLIAAVRARGLLLDWASAWTEGLELFRVNGYELVISDYDLPDTQHGLRLLVQMKQLIPSSKLVLISGALTPGAERSLADVNLLDHYYSKSDRNLTPNLAALIEEADKQASLPTDWRSFAAGHLADLDRDHPHVERIDELLRSEVEKRG